MDLYTEIQLDAFSGGVDIRHLGDGTSEIFDAGGYLCWDDEPAHITHTVPTDQVDQWLQKRYVVTMQSKDGTVHISRPLLPIRKRIDAQTMMTLITIQRANHA